ncbi:interleukin-1 receptor-associated kinase-like 2 [Callorhinchus milii]|uniref:non-specific serine/threonine protein kinase n=1 Tax=Callorhinchus milii TaxID=7868 RepID=V9KF63_CALMI|nr:interleukin-1 receptor-associated kinase-like 2 [Callorhinchus milii]|eukprot:gi/632946678/ref/XP_007888675.1/ PREDICTED: interleukin-1 receptor-associated kinase-like 2 [Callorhinchus milii]
MSSQNFVYDIPAGIMEEFYRVMDTLVDVAWMRFASCIITNQTELRSIESFGRRERSRTKELMWIWGMRQGTVQQLLDLLNDMKLYRAINIILSWKPATHFITQPSSCRIPSSQPCETYRTPTFASGQEQKDSFGPDSTNNARLSHPLPDQKASASERISLSESQNEESNGRSPKMEADPSNCAWTLQDLRKATNNFDERHELGRGTFGHVYKGRRFNTDYAIKWLKESENIDWEKVQDLFHKEVQSLYRHRHPNILALEGCCAECGVFCLIYRYMSNGSLENSLQNTNPGHGIPWVTRVKIALGTARAIQYLHKSDVPLIHGNIKSSNILLDEHFTPRLGDFGLVKTVSLSTGSNHTTVKTKTLQGPLAYLPDEYIRHRQLSVKVDTFSFGIVLSEILTGIKAIDENRKPVFLKDLMLEELGAAKETRSSADVSYSICQNYLDKKGGPVPLMITVKFAEIACLCLGKKRPEMNQVYMMLENLEHQLQGLHSTPEELKDLTFKFNQLTSCPQENTEVLSPCLEGQSLHPAIFKYLPETASQVLGEEFPRTPCESDESDSFGHYRVPTRLAPLSSAGMRSLKLKSTCGNSDFDSCPKAIEETSSFANSHDYGSMPESAATPSGFDQELLQPNRLCRHLDWSGAGSDCAALSPPGSQDIMADVLTHKEVNYSNLSMTPSCGNSNVALSPGSPRSVCELTVSNTASQHLESSSRYTCCRSSFINKLSDGPRCTSECSTLSSTFSTVGEFFTCSDLTINPHKKKLLDKILLYEEDQIDSAQLLSVHSLPEED